MRIKVFKHLCKKLLLGDANDQLFNWIGIGKLIDGGGGVKVLTIIKVVKNSKAKVSVAN